MTANRRRFIWFYVLALVTLPAQARAHLHLASSTPAQGDSLQLPVREIRLRFSEAVLSRYTIVTVTGLAGADMGAGTLKPVGAEPSREYVLVLDRPLLSGTFSVKWKTAGNDGHAVSGMFAFSVNAPQTPPTAAVPVGRPASHGAQGTPSAEIPPLYRPESSLAWILARWLNLLAVVVVVGAAAFRFGVVERARRALSETIRLDIDTAARRAGATAAAALLVSSGLRLWLQSGSLHGPQRMWQSNLLSAMIFQTGWGKAWLAQTVAGIGFLAAVLIKSKDRLESWFSAAAFAVIVGSASSFAGHAVAVQQMAIVPVLDDAVHVLAASAWLGTLALVLFAGLPVTLRDRDGLRATAILVHTFSPVALAMGSIAIFTGAMNAFIHIGAISELWSTPYGRVLALKIGLVLIALTMGAYNWQIVRPRLGSDAATSLLKTSVRSELAMAVIIILITAVLVGTPTT